jgi:thymidylate synthase (FAD)
MVQSKRYVQAEKGDFTFIMPKGLSEDSQDKMDKVWKEAMNTYKELIASGVKKEDARAVLPANTSTKVNVTGNLQAWWSFFKLRLNKHAQTEIRELADIIYDLLAEAYPKVFTEKLYKELT